MIRFKTNKLTLAIVISVIGALYWMSIPHNLNDCNMSYLKSAQTKVAIHAGYKYCRLKFPK